MAQKLKTFKFLKENAKTVEDGNQKTSGRCRKTFTSAVTSIDRSIT
jgi:hypothetical protein